jgi:hypothetical protein
MATLDLNAKRAARTEAENKPHEVTLGFADDGTDRIYQLKPRMPLEFSDLLRAGRMREAMQLLLIDPTDWEQLRKAQPDEDDLLAIADLYGVNLPESPASAPSSSNGGGPSRPTSNGSTGSTSPKPASARKRSGSAGSRT